MIGVTFKSGAHFANIVCHQEIDALALELRGCVGEKVLCFGGERHHAEAVRAMQGEEDIRRRNKAQIECLAASFQFLLA